jgi:hypothetical protein
LLDRDKFMLISDTTTSTLANLLLILIKNLLTGIIEFF